MKWKYYILLLGILIFFGETISIPYLSKGSTASGTCKMRMVLKAEGKADCCKKHGDKKTQKPMNCIDCPLCCTTITASFFVKPVAPSETGKITYGPFKNPLLSSYHDEMWKPPNSFPYSMS